MNEKIPCTEGNNKSDDSDPNNDDENDGKYGRKTVKVHQSKNLEAERKRRKKLNDRLYSLRALVPNISKLDRTAILGDAINYVKELQERVKDLQVELEQDSDNDEHDRITAGNDNCTRREHEDFVNGFHKGSSADKLQQMEPQVEVFQLEGNEFFVKVFCEHKAGGFMKLMEALNSLGFQVINVNATRHTCLVSNMFTLGKTESESEAIPVDHLKESLLELARNRFDWTL
ncbi:hypothetical protein BUALT_Bualt15G0007500 [Buddleja alternifolia]|uniref:BHLH domain-containing protein n=1 Tax=Buddleja alternifolia TaxID=168488 RepID=A0AAV6WJR0_9LAMI|nr:hypothetical protein BUALT_Bualt15G0007500 [Buddleja alternifolia]